MTGSQMAQNRDRIDSHELDFRRRGSSSSKKVGGVVQADSGPTNNPQNYVFGSHTLDLLAIFTTADANPPNASKTHKGTKNKSTTEGYLIYTIRLSSSLATILAIIRSFICGVTLLLIFGRLFVTVAIAVHAAMDSAACHILLWPTTSSNGVSFKKHGIPTLLLHSLIDIACNYIYIVAGALISSSFFVEPDGTVCDDWTVMYTTLVTVRIICALVCATRLLVLVTTATIILDNVFKVLPKAGECTTCHNGVPVAPRAAKFKAVKTAWIVSAVIAVSWMLGAGIGCIRYVVLTTPPNQSEIDAAFCDPLDTSDCILPFPSNFYRKADSTTATGYSVNISPEQLPITKSGEYVDPSVANELDGFSTIAPILFSLPGLTQSPRLGIAAATFPTPTTLSTSTTAASLTLLVDVVARTLVPHFTDLLTDSDLVILQPAMPLHHDRHYAVVLLNAATMVDDDVVLLPPSAGFEELLREGNKNDALLSRNYGFREVLLPAVYEAAPWIERPATNNGEGGGEDEEGGEQLPLPVTVRPPNVQLMFDFNTVSENSQLGSIRKVRDSTSDILSKPEWDWVTDDRVKTIKTVDHDCGIPGNYIARTVHQQIPTPWFLKEYGSGHRGTVLDKEKVEKGETELFGNLKFVVQVPCSLQAAALDEQVDVDTHTVSKKELTAVVEFGHGLFYTREEMMDSTFLHRMANNNGWLMVAADWRGMSLFDLPILMKVLLADPSLFRATLDNLIQGYVSKLCMLHYVHNGMLDAEFLKFSEVMPPVENDLLRQDGPLLPIPRQEGGVSVNFYGISQGGILGAGYNAMMSVTGLLHRSALGVPGTPFALIMGKSEDFNVFNDILLLNFYSKRHIKIMVSIIQMAWDTVEAASWLSPPVDEVPLPVLIQAGLADAEVPVSSAEILARCYGAAILTGNPTDVYGLERVEGWEQGGIMGPSSALTEILYQREVEEATKRAAEGQEDGGFNKVHYCVRHDPALQQQIVEFFKDGRIIDPCISDQCIRSQAYCDTDFGRRRKDK